ncbi:MAG: helix-turn-helix domain-containing protein [Acutalibacteraceae bacterium]
MDNYVTGAAIKRLREKKEMTQAELADRIGVTAKAVSKWETAKGLPDISLIEPLAAALGASVTELMSGETVVNGNVSANMLRAKLYVCPVCGNVIHAVGEAAISCCGVNLPPLEAEETDGTHQISVEPVEHEYYVTVDHEMTKEHYISFIAYVTSDRFELVKLYPEGNAETRFARRGHGFIYYYCNRHGLMKKKI